MGLSVSSCVRVVASRTTGGRVTSCACNAPRTRLLAPCRTGLRSGETPC